jgi:hypothetical protein
MGNLRLYGSTSGYTELAPPAVAPDGVLSLPSGTGTLLTAEGGKVLQVVRAATATSTSTTSTSFTDVTEMSVTITPTKDTSTIILIAQFNGLVSSPVSGYLEVYYSITDSGNTSVSGAESVTNATRNFSYTTTGTTVYHRGPKTLIAYANPASVSAQTYKLRHRVVLSTNVSTIANNVQTGQMYAIEVSA